MKKLALIVLIVSIGLLAYLLSTRTNVENSAPRQPQRVIPSASSSTANPPPPIEAGSRQPPKARNTTAAMSARDYDELHAQWLAEHGYFTDNRTYYLLSKEELRQLADAGDMAALQHIAFTQWGDNIETAIETYRLAAAYGSTMALVAMADTALFSLPEEPTARNVAVTRSLSFALAALDRGDYQTAPSKIRELRQRFDISDETMAEACSAAIDEVQATERVRTSAGLGYFGDAEPPEGLFSQRTGFDAFCG